MSYISRHKTKTEMFQALKRSVIRNSEADDFSEACKEWVVTKFDDDEQCSSYCTCGHDIRFVHTIENTINHKELVVGSECVKRFENQELITNAAAMVRASRNYIEVQRIKREILSEEGYEFHFTHKYDPGRYPTVIASPKKNKKNLLSAIKEIGDEIIRDIDDGRIKLNLPITHINGILYVRIKNPQRYTLPKVTTVNIKKGRNWEWSDAEMHGYNLDII